MPRYTVSTRPRRGAQSFTSFTSTTTSSLDTSASFTSSARTSNSLKKCHYCPTMLADDSARRQHISNTPGCTAEERATLQRAVEAERQRAEASAPADKRPRATVEEIPDVDAAPECPAPPTPGPSRPGRSAAGDASASARVDPEPGPSRPTRASTIGHNHPARPQLRQRGGLYVEAYPDSLAGAPISQDHAPAPDLDAYMQSCGRMGDPENFETAELLMTTGLTDAAKDRHLKSNKVSIIIHAIRR